MTSISERMRNIGQRDTDCELRLRSLLHAKGLRFRVHYSLAGVRTKPDIAFTQAKVAVFIDGCFWHGCPTHGTMAKTNTEFWSAKIAANRDRDIRSTRSLTDLGWRVVRLWSHEPLPVMERRVREALEG